MVAVEAFAVQLAQIEEVAVRVALEIPIISCMMISHSSRGSISGSFVMI